MTTQDPFDNDSPPPLAPPVQAGPLPVAQVASKWPMVLGILAIILGAYYLLSTLIQVVVLITEAATGQSLQTQPAQQNLQPPKEWMIASVPVWLTIGGMLLAGGIGLVRRRRWSVRVLRIWALINLLVLVVGGIVTFQVIPAALEQVRHDTAKSGAPASLMVGIIAVGMCIGALFSIAPPIFTLIWFARRKIKNEVSTWA